MRPGPARNKEGDVLATVASTGRSASGPYVSARGRGAGSGPVAEPAASGVDATGHLARAAADGDVRLDAARQFAQSVAHDFNNILAAVVGNLYVLKRRCGGDAAVVKLVEAAINATQRGNDLTNRLHAFANSPALERSRVDVNALIAALDAAVKRTVGADIAVITTLADDLPPTETDPVLLESAIVSLAANARDAMAGSGNLTIETARVVVDDAIVARNPALNAGVYAGIAVGDDGRGMTPAAVERAFEPFFSTRLAGRGSGVGLSLVADVVKRSNGYLTVDSGPGRGTRIGIHLPAAPGGTRP